MPTRLPLLAAVTILFGTACQSSSPSAREGLYDACYDGAGVCVDPSIIDEAQRALLAQDHCARGLLCLPRSLARGAVPVTCTSVGGSEGRCLYQRLPRVAEQLEQLPPSFCEANERCVPCYDVFSGEPTGACDLPGDSGPTQPALVFAECCNGDGRCLPRDLVDSEQQASLARSGCAEDELCVPQMIIEQRAPERCDSLGDSEGRCLPTCLPIVEAQADQLPRSSCASDERCAPCQDPVSAESTGACNLPGDPGPREPAFERAACCEQAGHCLPSALISEQQRALLGQDQCPEAQLCVLDQLLLSEAPKSCASVGAVEGRCLATCLPLVAAQIDQLPRSFCSEAERCVPCFDPLSGEATGACNLPGDDGPNLPAKTFEACCSGTGHCLPGELVDEAQQASFARMECESAQLCVPDQLSAGKIETCAALGGFEGRCLSECLPLIAAELERLDQSSCARDQRCAPCFDPVSGAATGACALPGDAGPQQPPEMFASCCNAAGRCVPDEQLPPAQRDGLAREQCAEGQRCAPQFLLEGRAAQSCMVQGVFEGRCLPECLPLIAAQGSALQRGSCEEGARCAPCFDPVSAAATGACSLPGDPGPTQPPTTLPTCCGGAGRCLPRAQVPTEQQATLGQGECAAEQLCLPQFMLDEVAADSCASVAGFEGRCLPTCLPQIAAQANSAPVSSCDASERCAPCFDPFTGAATGACNLPKDPGPKQPAGVFDTCCNMVGATRGRCVPADQVAEPQRSLLPAETCENEGDVCLPNSLVPPSRSLPSCTVGEEPGACVPRCLMSEEQILSTLQQECEVFERCVPCKSGGTPTGVCG